MGLFTPITNALAAQGKPSFFRCVLECVEREQERCGILADHLTIRWLATAVADRTGLSFDEAAGLLVGMASGGGPDLRTSKGMACASIILGVPGEPITPTQH